MIRHAWCSILHFKQSSGRRFKQSSLEYILQKAKFSYTQTHVGNSPSGKAPDSESGIGGSNPSFPTIIKTNGLRTTHFVRVDSETRALVSSPSFPTKNAIKRNLVLVTGFFCGKFLSRNGDENRGRALLEDMPAGISVPSRLRQ